MQKCGKGGGLGTLLHWLLLQNSIFFQMSAPKTPSGYRLQTGPGVSQTCAGAFFVCFLQRGVCRLQKMFAHPAAVSNGLVCFGTDANHRIYAATRRLLIFLPAFGQRHLS